MYLTCDVWAPYKILIFLFIIKSGAVFGLLYRSLQRINLRILLLLQSKPKNIIILLLLFLIMLIQRYSNVNSGPPPACQHSSQASRCGGYILGNGGREKPQTTKGRLRGEQRSWRLITQICDKEHDKWVYVKWGELLRRGERFTRPRSSPLPSHIIHCAEPF